MVPSNLGRDRAWRAREYIRDVWRDGTQWLGVQTLRPQHGEDEPRRRKEDSLNWKVRAPRWVLLTALLIAATLCGALAEKIHEFETKDQARLEAAIADVPSKYQARVSERLAAVEAQQTAQERALADQTNQQRALAAAMAENTTQLRLLTAEVRRMNGGK